MKIKKIIAVCLALAALMMFAGCAQGGNDIGETDRPTEGTSMPQETDEPVKNPETEWEIKYLTITYNGKSFLVGSKESEMRALWGEPINVEESASCLFDGWDRTITYTIGTIFSFPLDSSGENIVDEIYITDPSYEFMGGIKIGATKEDVIAAIGEEFFMDGKSMMVYNYGNNADNVNSTPKLYFYLENGVVAGFGVCANKYHI